MFLAEGWGSRCWRNGAAHRRVDAATCSLVVDDDAATRVLLTELFNGNGYAVVLAENSEEGLKQLLDYTPDLVISICRCQ